MQVSNGFGAVRLLAAVGAVVSLAPLAAAQDSVSPAGGLPGDALDAYRTTAPSHQSRDYAVDLAVLTSSWGHRYAYGPIIKTSRGTSTGIVYFNHLVGAQAASNRFDYGPFFHPSYQAWAAAGQGINSTVNTTPTDNGSGLYGTLNTAALSGHRFGVALMEYSGGPDTTFGTGDDENNIVSAVVCFQERRLSRLFVSRTMALQNRPQASGGFNSTASFGLGSVDEAGNVHILADGTGMVSAGKLTNKDLIRISTAQRNATLLNFVQQAGVATPTDPGATQVVLETTPAAVSTLTTPGMIPPVVAGRPVLLDADFGSNLMYESTPGTLSSTRAQLSAPSGAARGNVSFSAQVFAPIAGTGTPAGTGALLSHTDSNTKTRGLTFFTLRTDGSVAGEREVQLPTTAALLTDPTDGYSPGAVFSPLSAHEFTNYQSQVPFRGGNGQVAMTVLPNGDLLAAALVAATGGGGATPQGQNTYLAVARINSITSAVSWTIAAHTGNAQGAAGGQSKAILGDYGADGIPGTGDAGEGDGVVDAAPIGRIALRSEVFPDSAAGPSISSPAMDRAGNLYFLATVALNTTGGPLANKTVALLRANYNQASGAYQLEVLAKNGDSVLAPNARKNYQLQLIGLSDLDSVDSGAVWSGNIVQDSLPGAAAGSAPYGSPAALGAMVFRARLVYDFNGDGQFNDPSLQGGTGTDQAYNVLMAILPSFAPGDFDRNGTVEPADIAAFVNRWFADLSGPNTHAGDWDGNGTVEPADIAAFVNDWFASL